MKKGSKALKIALVAVVACIIVVGIILLISKPKDKILTQEAGSEAQVSASAKPSQMPTETPKPKRKVYPIGKWELPIPHVNPFGSQENYKEAKYTFNTYQELSYINNNNMETSRMTCGELWELQVEWQDEAVDAFDDLRLYISEMNGEGYASTRGDDLVFHLKSDDGVDWWGYASKSGNGYNMKVYKEAALKPDQVLSFKTGDYQDRVLYFLTHQANHKFQTMKISLSEGELDCRGKANYAQGEYERRVYYNKRLYAYKTNNYVLDDIPQESFSPLLWEITWREDADPKEISFTLQEGDSISPVRYGERLGALKVEGVSYGEVKVEPASHSEIHHPECNGYTNYKGDVTPEGDTIFWLPAGYWNVFITPHERQDVSSGEAKLIPVSEGEMTVLTIPPTFDASLVTKEKGVAGGDESGIKILETIETGLEASITFQLLDSKNPDMVPTLKNTEIFEGGTESRIIQIERLRTPPSVVLVLDSSGSMRGQMEQTVVAAKTFIEGLPDDAFIQVIDFDTKPNVLKGTTKAEALKGLNSVKANGATALYDSILVGLELLKDKERPTLVVFTDGVDANNNDTGPGSKATKQEVMTAVEQANITLFAIGFGPKHDNTTLLELAGVSDGMYYPAEDKAALDNVFQAINNKLGNTFKATYERPKEAAPSDMPVISLVLDTSGSMDMDPSDPRCDYRIDKVKSVYHDFINRLPQKSLVQLMRFSDYITIDQVFTERRPELLQALGELEAGGGTEIMMSVQSAYKGLKAIPSNKRVIVFMTDAALEVDESQKESFERTLNEIRQQGIKILWVGLGVADSEEAFKWAADKSGGQYVISEDPMVLGKAFDDVLSIVENIPADKLTLSITIKNDSTNGSASQYSASRLVDFPMPKTSGDAVSLNCLSYKTGAKVQQYEKETAQLVYGSDIPTKEVKLYKKIPLNVKGTNQAMEWKANEAFFLWRLRGIDAPQGKCFMAVEMEMKNTMSIPYLIPDMTSHLFIQINNEGAYPASTATWLAEKPLTPPGEGGIMINPGETVHGVLVYMVPDVKTEQASLHFYDTKYGHITLSMIGEMKKQEIALEDLPTQAEGKLSDTFTLAIKAKKDLSEIEKVKLNDNSVFRVLEGELKTNVQALLDIRPMERFYLKMHTGKGPLMVPLNTTTAFMPYGFLKPVMLAPASVNKVRFVYQIPASLKDTKMELYGDIYGGALNLPVSGSNAIDEPGNSSSYEGDAMMLRVNALTWVKEIEYRNDNYVVADITVSDAVDGYGTQGFGGSFMLVRQGSSADSQQGATAGSAGLDNFASGGSSNEDILYPDDVTSELLFGVDQDWVVYDGNERRGLVVFRIPSGLKDETWILQSPYFQSLKLTVGNESYQDTGLLVKEVSPETDERFNKLLAEELYKVISEYQSLQALNPSQKVKKIGIDSSVSQKNNVPVPITSVEGATRIKSIASEAEFQSTIQSIKWLPSQDSFDHFRYSPEAVLTQGWGTQGDLANLVGGLLAKQGYYPKLRRVNVTDKGKEALLQLGQVEKTEISELPAWAYTDEQGQSRVFVIPFMKDLSELSGLVYLPGNQGRLEMRPVECEISVYYKVSLTNEGLNSAAGDAASALGGGDSAPSEPKEVRVLHTRLPLDQLSNDAVDIGVSGGEKGYTAVLMTGTDRIVGEQFIDPVAYRIESIRTEVGLPNGRFNHETRLEEGDSIGGVFHTLGINLPDLPQEAADALQKAADNQHKAAVKPDEVSTLRWYGRSVISRFIAAQTVNEQMMAKGLGVTVGRTSQERCIMVTMRKKNAEASFSSSIDLMQTANQIHRGPGEAVRAFNIMSGIYNSRLEGVVLPGDSYDFMAIWEKSPHDMKLFLSLVENRHKDLETMKQQGYPEPILKQLENNNNVIIIPNKPTLINGEERWAWLEIDPNTYETIAVLDTGEHGSFAEYLITMAPEAPSGNDYRNFIVGAFIGIDVSVWSVCSFSLELDNPKQILNQAKEYTFKVCEYLDKFMSYSGDPSSMAQDYVKDQNAEISKMAEYYEKIMKSIKIENPVNFKEGFQSGAAFYFKMMGN